MVLELFGTFWKMEGKFEFQFGTEVEYKLNLGLNIEFGLSLKVSEVFQKKLLWFPLLLDSGIRGCRGEVYTYTY